MSRVPLDRVNEVHQILLVGITLGVSRRTCAKLTGLSEDTLSDYLRTKYKDLAGFRPRLTRKSNNGK